MKRLDMITSEMVDAMFKSAQKEVVMTPEVMFAVAFNIAVKIQDEISPPDPETDERIPREEINSRMCSAYCQFNF
jgi:hypothetical protein